MQEDINRQTITLCISGGKLTARAFRSATAYASKQIDKMKANNLAKQNAASQKEEPVRGEQTLADLTAGKDKLTNIQITDKNIGSFHKVARKYDIDYALKKDPTTEPPHYYVFFKAKDKDQLQPAFKEFTAMTLDREKRPTIRERLAQAQEQTKTKHREREKVKAKDREVTR